MTVELLAIGLVLVGGIAWGRGAGFNGWGLPAIGFIGGVALLITLTGLLVGCGVSTRGWVPPILTAVLPLAWCWWLHRCGQDLSVSPRLIAATAIIALLVVFATYQLHLVKLSPDSFNYLNTGALLARDRIADAAPNWLQLRLLGVPAMHAPANMSGAYYLRSVTPLLAVATLMLLGWISHHWCKRRLQNRRWGIALAVLTPMLLLSHHRFAYHAFYINGHLLIAVCLLVLAGGSWLLVNGATIDSRAVWRLQMLCIPPLVLTRPDGALFAGLVMLPTLLRAEFSARRRACLLGVLALSIVAWHGFLAFRYTAAGQPVPVTVTAMIVLGVCSAGFVSVLFWRRAAPYLPHLLPITEASLWLGLAVFAWRDFAPFRASVRATFHNVMLDAGGWGMSLKLLAAVVIVVLLLTRDHRRVHLRFPVTTFIPLCLVLGFLRDLPYRVGTGDSLNRMFLHILPLAILLILSAAKVHRLSAIGEILRHSLAGRPQLHPTTRKPTQF